MITLKTLSEATPQQVFDQVLSHLRVQGRKSTITHDSNACMYRSYDGLKCAAGALISDEEYNEMIEHEGWSALVDQGIAPVQHQVLIASMQKIHDTACSEYFSKDVELGFRWVAENHGLVYTKP